jgi:hypothetical protein
MERIRRVWYWHIAADAECPLSRRISEIKRTSADIAKTAFMNADRTSALLIIEAAFSPIKGIA